jgi:hypothetical protein
MVVMPKILLMQFDTDPGCAQRRQALAGLGAEIVETEPRWPAFFDVVTRERPDVIIVSLGKLPSHGRESARYIKDGFNSRNIPVILTDVPAAEREKTQKSVPAAQIVEKKGLADAVRRLLSPETDKV